MGTRRRRSSIYDREWVPRPWVCLGDPRSARYRRVSSRVQRADSRRRLRSQYAAPGQGEDADELHAFRRSLRARCLSPLRPQRPPTAARLARALAQLRRGGRLRERARHRAPGLRPGRDPPRPRQQLRPAPRLRRGGDGPHPRPRPPPVPRRARDLHEGRLPHVARALRRVGLAEVRAVEPRPEPEADAPRVRGHLLFPPPRPGDAARGDDDGPRPGGAAGQGPLRRDLELPGGDDRGGRLDPPAPRDALPHPPAPLLDVRPLDRGRPHRGAREGRHRLHRLLPARPGPPLRQVPRGHPARARGPRRRTASCAPST